MKKCPFCAVPIPINRSKAEIGAVQVAIPKKETMTGTEEIQEKAIKCKHRNKFLTKFSAKPKIPWSVTPAALVISFFTVGPFALPLVWFNPAYSQRKKCIITVIVLFLTGVLAAVFFHAAKTILDYYKQAGIF